MIPISLSIIACFGWGIADYIGGMKSRSVPVVFVLTVSTFTGVLLLLAITRFFGGPFPADPALWWAALAGLIGVVAMFFLYRALSMGIISILAPISATGVILPVIFGLLTGESMSGLSFSGVIMAFFGSLLAVMESRPGVRGKKITRGVGTALISALFVGFYFITMDLACVRHPIWASLVMRSSTLFFLILYLLLTRTKVRMHSCDLKIIVFMGIMDVVAAFCFALATSSGLLSQVAVISSLYPAVTVLLSAWLLKERIAKIQTFGVALALTGVVLISAF